MKEEELVAELKKKYSTIFKLEIPCEDENKIIFLRKLDRVTFEAGSKLMEKSEIQAAEVFLRGLYIGGDELDPIIKDFEQLREASALLGEIVALKGGNVAKL